MNCIAPDGSWGLWSHIGAAGVSASKHGEYLRMCRESPDESPLGCFTFQWWALTANGARLVPEGCDFRYRPSLPIPVDQETTMHRTRFIIEVLRLDNAEVAA